MANDPNGSMRVPAGLLGWLVLAAVWMTWAPFEFREGWPPLQLMLRFEPETVGHFFLLMPFGVLAVAYRRRADGRWSALPLAAVAIAGLVLEAGQGWVVGRSVSPHDVLVGYLGAVLAIGVAERFVRRGASAETVSRSVAAITLLLVWALMLSGTVDLNRGLRLAGWSPAFPVSVASETGGERPYLGTVSEARICSGAALDTCVDPGAPAEARARLARLAMETGRVRVTARVVSAADDQEGPTRIVTFSDGAYLRNVTLAQRHRNLTLRIRTPRSGFNGTGMEFVLLDAIHAGERTWLDATFDRGTVTLRADSDARTLPVHGTYRPPFRNSLRTQGLDRPRPLQPLRGRAACVGAVVQFLGLGLGLGYVVRSRAVRMTLAPALALLVVCLLDRTLGHTLSPTPGDLALAAIAAALGAFTRSGHFRQR